MAAFTVAINGWWTRQSGYTTSFDGSVQQYQLAIGYRLSKRTTLYSEIDYSRYHGGTISAQFVGLNDQSPTVSPSQIGMMVGYGMHSDSKVVQVRLALRGAFFAEHQLQMRGLDRMP
ncbi:MAG: hypothetical protein CBARDCOR_1132 [uncultured Caballeronia sp.]|nr:MAG: hypothetical protein CBARDCOR_1132 [uncultured Caballeronia sp.]